jgi:hypothetical protein
MNLRSVPKHPGCPAVASLRGGAEEQAVLVGAGVVTLGSQPRITRATTTEGARASHRGGEHGTLRKQHGQKPGSFPDSVPFTRRCSAHAARIRKEPGSLPPPRRTSSNAPSSPRKRRRPCEGDAERVVRRHGSSASSHDLHGSCSLPSTRRGQNSSTAPKETWAGERGDALPETRRASGTRFGSSRRRETVTGANADGGGSLARRRIPGSRACPRVEHALPRSVVQSWPREAVGFFPPLLERHGSSRRGAGARSRVDISDVASKDALARAPETTRRTVRRTPSWTFTEASGRKARDGIDETLGSSERPTEGRHLGSSTRIAVLHGSGETAVSARTCNPAVA